MIKVIMIISLIVSILSIYILAEKGILQGKIIHGETIPLNGKYYQARGI